MYRQTLSLTKLHSGFSESSFKQGLYLGPAFVEPVIIQFQSRILPSQFKENLPPFVSDHPGVPPVSQFSTNAPIPDVSSLYFSTIVDSLNLILGDKFPAVFSVFGVEPDFSPVTKVLNKVFLTTFNKCQNIVYLPVYSKFTRHQRAAPGGITSEALPC